MMIYITKYSINTLLKGTFEINMDTFTLQNILLILSEKEAKAVIEDDLHYKIFY